MTPDPFFTSRVWQRSASFNEGAVRGTSRTHSYHSENDETWRWSTTHVQSSQACRREDSNLQPRAYESLATFENAGENAQSGKRAAPGAAPRTENAPDGPDLSAIADALAALPEADRPAVVAHVTEQVKLWPDKLAMVRALMNDAGPLTLTDSNEGKNET